MYKHCVHMSMYKYCHPSQMYKYCTHHERTLDAFKKMVDQAGLKVRHACMDHEGSAVIECVLDDDPVWTMIQSGQ
jgi:hypothetical protein